MKIDKEYATQLMDEVKWLSNHGIKYTFVKVTEEKITIYKYRKRELYKIVEIPKEMRIMKTVRKQ